MKALTPSDASHPLFPWERRPLACSSSHPLLGGVARRAGVGSGSVRPLDPPRRYAAPLPRGDDNAANLTTETGFELIPFTVATG